MSRRRETWPDRPPAPKRDARGRWYVRPYLGTDPDTGRKVRPMHALAATTYAAAVREGREWWERMTGRESLGDYLARWAREKPATDATRAARAVWLAEVRRTTAAALDVRAVTPADLDGLARDLAAHGGRDGKPLAPSQVRAALGMVGSAYRDAVRAGTLDRTPYLGAADHTAHATAPAASVANGPHETGKPKGDAPTQRRTKTQEPEGEGATNADSGRD